MREMVGGAGFGQITTICTFIIARIFMFQRLSKSFPPRVQIDFY